MTKEIYHEGEGQATSKIGMVLPDLTFFAQARGLCHQRGSHYSGKPAIWTRENWRKDLDTLSLLRIYTPVTICQFFITVRCRCSEEMRSGRFSYACSDVLGGEAFQAEAVGDLHGNPEVVAAGFEILGIHRGQKLGDFEFAQAPERA